MAGFARTGEWFAFDAFGVRPDLIHLREGRELGYVPVGGVAISDAVASVFDGPRLPRWLDVLGSSARRGIHRRGPAGDADEGVIENARRIGEEVHRPAPAPAGRGDRRSSERCAAAACVWAVELVSTRPRASPWPPHASARSRRRCSRRPARLHRRQPRARGAARRDRRCRRPPRPRRAGRGSAGRGRARLTPRGSGGGGPARCSRRSRGPTSRRGSRHPRSPSTARADPRAGAGSRRRSAARCRDDVEADLVHHLERARGGAGVTRHMASTSSGVETPSATTARASRLMAARCG